MNLPQNSSGLYLAIQKIGCFFRSCLYIAEAHTGKELTVEQINSMWDLAHRCHYIDSHDNVIKSAEIINMAMRQLGDFGRYVEVALFQDFRLTYYPSVKDRRTTAFIQKIDQSGPNKYHFRVVDKYGQLIWDPHLPQIKCNFVYYTICYRYDAAE